MPSWVSSLIQKTEVPGTTLSWPRGPGTEWEVRPDPTAPKTHGRAGWDPSGSRQATVAFFHPLPLPQGQLPSGGGGMASLSLARPGREDALGSHQSTQAVFITILVAV